MSSPAFEIGSGDQFVVAPTTYLLRLEASAALFCERRQQLFGLNDTALLIWDGLASGAPADVTVGRLQDLGLSAEDAQSYVLSAADGWSRDGHLIPARDHARLAQTPTASRRLVIDGFRIDIHLHGAVSVSDIDAVFGHLAGDGGAPGPVLAIVEQGGRHAVFVNGVPRGWTDDRGAVPALKAVITELYAASVTDGFLAHGALLRGGDKTIFLTGEPGAGKSTLTLALAAAGLAFGGDDIVRISSAGLATAAPFAAASKTGAWELLAHRLPGLMNLTMHLRGDGQHVRYLVPPTLQALEPAPLRFVLLLEREPDAEPAFQAIDPLDALVIILDSAFSKKGAVDGATLSALAGRLQDAACYRFIYSHLDPAVEAVKSLL